MSLSKCAALLRPAGLVMLSLALAGCGFRPLYLENGAPAAGAPQQKASIGRELAGISVQLGATRESILLRNNLIFAFTGGGDDSANPVHRLDYTIIKSASPFTVEAGSGRQSAAFVTIQVTYQLLRIGSLDPVFRGRAIGRASFDKPAQRFAAIRAERDAEDRAVGDVSEAIRNALASYFMQKSQSGS
ncbi:hypothetical protein [Candidatus Raskinella chloraquaticus]|uniref:hypothetical protein n=1 Tax=Candidatus Raskinella chloraquaticus TaxID=1951219 RepID=UPI00366F5DAB